jgi:hypothetical protein
MIVLTILILDRLYFTQSDPLAGVSKRINIVCPQGHVASIGGRLLKTASINAQ